MLKYVEIVTVAKITVVRNLGVCWKFRKIFGSNRREPVIVQQIAAIFGRIVDLMKQAWNLVHR